jgi:AcrR family transcriptional regulator
VPDGSALPEAGRRERKKRQTRQAIADAAMLLFREHGFDAVTIAQVARAADVSIQTVFNHFPSKDDLFFASSDGRFEQDLVAAVRACGPGQSLLAALGTVAGRYFDRALATGEFEAIETTARLIEASPALQARQRADAAKFATTVAEAIAEKTTAAPTDLRPLLLANAGIAVYQTIFEIARRRVLTGERGAPLRSHLRNDVQQAFDLLKNGLDVHSD